MTLDADQVAALFTRADGNYHFARWGRPIVPVVFGVDDDTLPYLKDAIAQTVAVTGGVLAETDPEIGANFMWFFCSDWEQLRAVPNLEKLFSGFDSTLDRLQKTGANQYRRFVYDDAGGIQLCVVLLRMDGTLAEMSIQTLATSETLQSLLVWGEGAFANETPIAVVPTNGICVVKPQIATIVRAAYAETMPVAASEASHALRLAARASVLMEGLSE